jgi:large subunit ribosomal protein L23
MALFSLKKKKVSSEPKAPHVTARVAEPETPELASAAHPSIALRRSVSDVLLRPRITEKGTIVSAHRAYAFNVAPWANKREIAAAVMAAYKVTPTKVTVARIPRKSRFVRGKWGVKTGGKKAYVFLKEGEEIEFV